MPGGMDKLLKQAQKQAQKMQQDMERVQAELAEREVKTSVGGGVVEVTVTCDNRLRAITIKPEAVDPDDVEMLQDLIVAGVNQALDEATRITASEMARVTAGLGGPGGLGGMMGGFPGL